MPAAVANADFMYPRFFKGALFRGKQVMGVRLLK